MDDTTRGGQWIIEFYTDSREKQPAFEFIEGLQNHEQAPIYRAIDLLRKYGPTLNKPHAEHIEGKLWELRAGAGRVFVNSRPMFTTHDRVGVYHPRECGGLSKRVCGWFRG